MADDFLYIIKSGNMRYTKGGGSGGGSPGFSPRISLTTAYKVAQKSTAEKLIEDRISTLQRTIEIVQSWKPDVINTAERNAKDIANYEKQLAEWRAAKVVAVWLTEVV